MQIIKTYSEEDTKKFAFNLAKILKKGSILILKGELGCGKTKFTEGILKYFNLDGEISSPTFTIVNEYHNDMANIYHFDLYRLNDIYEFENIGGEEYFEKGICIFEWGEMIEDILPKDYIKLSFNKMEDDDNGRIIEINVYGNEFKNIDFNDFVNQKRGFNEGTFN